MMHAIHCPDSPAWYDLPEGVSPEGIHEMRLWPFPEPPDLTDPVGLTRTILMHKGHDYRVNGSRFRFCYSGGGGSWVILTYGPAHIRCGCCERDLPSGARFCGYCGQPTA